jgi:hypothetical protein
MNTIRLRPLMYFAMGIAVTAVAAWSLSAWRASAAVSADESTFVAVSPTRILDTRENIGLDGPFESQVAQDLRVTGTIVTKSGTIVVVPDGATGVVLNVTVVGPTAAGFVSIRPADAPGVPTTSSLNFTAGDVIPNSVTVQMPTSGGDAGKIEITYDAFGQSGPTTEMLVDVVGYTKNAGLASLQAEVDQLENQVAALTAAGAQVVFDGDAAGGDLTGTYPNPTLGANSVGPSELVNGTVGLGEMNATLVDNASVTTAESLAQGECSANVPTPAPGAAIGSRTMVLGSRLLVGDVNPGWVATGGTASTIFGQANVQICNDGAPTGVPPTLSVSFFTLAP